MTEPGKRGFYEGRDSDGALRRLPRQVDPRLDGTSLAERHPRIFDVTAEPDSISLEVFDRLVEAAVPNDVVDRIEHVIAAGTTLARRGLADSPPIDVDAWRRGMILSWSHARDLVVVHDALGHPRAVAGHDTDELVLGIRLQERLAPSADPWYRDYVATLNPRAWTNVGFFNPHISASLFKWGDARGGVQNAMDAHRLAAHHQGTPERSLDWIERAVNFVVHHIPREHWGIRHEPRGSWDDLEPRMAEDPAIKSSEIGKVIARDAASLFALLEQEGKVVPWQLLRVPDAVSPAALEHARLIVLAARQMGVTRAGMDRAGGDDDECMNPSRVSRAEDMLRRLPEAAEAARRAGRDDLARTFSVWEGGL